MLTIKETLIIGLFIGGIMSAIITTVAKWKFITKKTFEKELEKMQETFCKKIDTLNKTVGAMDEKRERAKDVLAGKLEEIAKFMGAVQQFMKDTMIKK